MSTEGNDLYEILSISRTATKAEIKKAYHKAALSSHPDKVQPEEREDAEIRFKSVSQAYEILSDDQTRSLYDQHGMAAFDKSSGGFGGEPDLNDMFAQMFNMGGGFGGFAGAPGPGTRRRAKGKSELQEYEVSLEELYKGKSTKFASTKRIICSSCNGLGGKEKAKPKHCDTCKGKGVTTRLRPVGPGLVTQETVHCSTCSGRGSFFAEKDKCKKCKGARTIQQKKILELYVQPGSREGEKIVLAGEADQDPDEDEPGDLVFQLTETTHEVFERAGADLRAHINISLSEALTGFNRVVVTHLDGRGISLNVQQPNGKVIRPGQAFKITGEGMPVKRSDSRGDLYLVVSVVFPDDGWLKTDAAVNKVRELLPKPEAAPKTAGVVDEADFELVDDSEEFGAGSGDPRAGEWEDDDDDEAHAQTAQCAQQ